MYCYTLDFFSLLFHLMCLCEFLFILCSFFSLLPLFFLFTSMFCFSLHTVYFFLTRFLFFAVRFFFHLFSFLIKNYSAQTVQHLNYMALIFHFSSCKWLFIHNGLLDHLWALSVHTNDKVTHKHYCIYLWMLWVCVAVQLKFPNRNTCQFCM